MSFERGYSVFFKEIAKRTGLPRSDVRVAARALARKALAEYQRVFSEDDGLIAGSGYCATEAGYSLYARLSDGGSFLPSTKADSGTNT